MGARGVAWITVGLAMFACGGDEAAQPDASALVDAVVDAAPDAAGPPWPFALPAGFPTPRLPPGARLTVELAELGRHLFYDPRLSGNGTQSCGSCHQQTRAFTDGRTTGLGSTGEAHRRNASGLTNVAYAPVLTWANPSLGTLEAQALVPIFGEQPVELGATGAKGEILARFTGDPAYPARFAAAFPGDPAPVTWPNVVAALAAFQRRLISGNSPADRGELTESEQRGRGLFFSETLECHHCHGGFNFTLAVDHAGLPSPQAFYFNTGLYNVDGGYPAIDQGLWDFTFADADRGRFKPPSLRNVAVTAPYMHDGSVATLEEVLAIYERGGRLITKGANAGDGRDNPQKSPFVGGFVLTPQERADLLAFLAALTDDEFLSDPTLADPFAQ